ncbi:flagellar hook protein FlgE [Caulobacter sp. DWR1-3-2b1]|uniref:flagellar hook protein FlgE n=1 Tax=Caulobacter sp. DWR1-3-2b1 TaxID=2804670 RepID=UPI003CEAF2EC
MLGSIYIGMSGLNAYTKGLQTISNNVANLNTSGFKAASVRFTDVFSTGGGGLTFSSGSGPGQGGGGVRMAEPSTDFRQGDLRQSGGDLDLAIKGSGMLVLKDGDKTYYARTGQFSVDEEGFISLQGTKYHLAVLDGSRQAATLNIDAKRTSKPVATTKIAFADNLSSTGAEHTLSNMAVYDASGGRHLWTVKLKAAATPGEWDVTVTDDLGATLKTSKLKFIGSVVDASTAKIDVTQTVAGFDPLTVKLDFSSGVTSYSSGTISSLRNASTDGNGVGNLTSVTIDEEGRVKLTYSNTKTETLGAVAMADFRDPQGLTSVGGGLYESRDGGQVRLLPSGEDGAGTLVAQQIEASNVNLAEEFGELILVQRGFQASSQVVSIANDMIQQLFSIRGQG